MSSGIKSAFTFIWRIYNFSHCSQIYPDTLNSPKFSAKEMERTVWNLVLFHNSPVDKGSIACGVHRDPNDEGPETVSYNFKVAFLASNGAPLKSFTLKSGIFQFTKNSCCLIVSAPRSEVLEEKKEQYLPQDVLAIQCKMWKEEDSDESTCIHARSGLCTESASFVQTVEQFSSKASKQRKGYEIKSRTTGALIMCLEVGVAEGYDVNEKISVDFKVIEMRKKNKFMCNIFLLEASGKKTFSGLVDTRFYPEENKIPDLCVPLCFSKKELMDRKCEYLPQDVLSFELEFFFANGMILAETEQTDPDLHIMPKTVAFSNVYRSLDDIAKDVTTLLGYGNNEDSFVYFKTQKNNYRVHKIILCDRSSVFKSMFSNGETTNSSVTIKIDDIDDEIFKQFLKFLYYGNLDPLHWRLVCKLYDVADKYDVRFLKMSCGFLLMEELDSSNACEILELADKYQDSFLKNYVQSFILQHEIEIFTSDAWGDLIQSNPLLASQTMLSKYKKKRKLK